MSFSTCRALKSFRILIFNFRWRAFIFYSYFGNVYFSPLRSEMKVVSDTETNALGTPYCSPKSMYQLADKVTQFCQHLHSAARFAERFLCTQYDIKELKQQAAADIKSKLSPDNIFVELFSTFTSLSVAPQTFRSVISADRLLQTRRTPRNRSRLPPREPRQARGDEGTAHMAQVSRRGPSPDGRNQGDIHADLEVGGCFEGQFDVHAAEAAMPQLFAHGFLLLQVV